MSAVLEKQSKQLLVILADSALILVSLLLAYVLRFNTLYLEDYYLHQFLHALPVMLAVRLIVFAFMGLYRGMWRFVGMRDLMSLIQAITLSSGLSVGLLFLITRLAGYPRSVFIIEWFVSIVLLGGMRFTYRFYRETRHKAERKLHRKEKGVLIVGAGRAGELILREILGSYRQSYTPVGFVDDNRKKRNLTIHGYNVLGNTRDIPSIVRQYRVEGVFIAIPSASGAAKRRIMLTCKRANVNFKTLPAVGELLSGAVKVSSLREFQIEDLLGRAPVKLNTDAIRDYLLDKTVMVTGAGGSIGSELCRQIAQFSPRRLILFECSEYNLYKIQMQLYDQVQNVIIHPVIGDVLNQRKVERVLRQFQPEVVFHAAAYKHVPLMEQNAEEALRNNAFGTWIMANLARMNGVKEFVMVSTDKAVRPTNIMGASKRIAELICQGLGQESETKFVTVRFGNVLNSVGSVIPLFKQQIAKGGPVTVTHPDIYRYFMTIPEAAQLIMQAGAMGQGGEIFVLDMGSLVKVLDLARDMITLSGLEPDRDIKIEFTGLRQGEKLYEELLIDGERIKATLHDKIKVAEAETIEFHSLLSNIENLLNSLQEGFSEETTIRVKEIVPEYNPEGGGSVPSAHSSESLHYELSRTIIERDNPDLTSDAPQ